MPVSPARASCLRQPLMTLLADCRQRLDHLLFLRQLLKGSVYELKTRCGKPACHCASPDGPLHTATVLSWPEGSATRLRTLSRGERARLRQFAGDYRRFPQTRAALVKLHRQILVAVGRLERALLLPPPKPACSATSSGVR